MPDWDHLGWTATIIFMTWWALRPERSDKTGRKYLGR